MATTFLLSQFSYLAEITRINRIAVALLVELVSIGTRRQLFVVEIGNLNNFKLSNLDYAYKGI
jgi:hypothetical protein